MKKINLEIVVFLCGAAVMVLELDASRILAPYLGTSLYVWSSLIGIILGSLSLGYFLGGKIADKKPNFRTLSLVILSSGLLIGLVALIKEPLLFRIQNLSDIRLGSVLATVIFFAPSSILLGMVSPYATRLKIKTLEKSGTTVGNLYAISTLGSILGTFLAGFFLIPSMGNTKILYLLTAILILTSLIIAPKSLMKIKISLIASLIILITVLYRNNLFSSNWGVDIDTPYSRAIIFQGVDAQTNRPFRGLLTDKFGFQSAMFADKDDDLVFSYTKYYHLVEFFKPDFKQTLMIGGGAYSTPKDYLKRYPESTIDVVEIDSKITELAQKYFNLRDDPRLKIFHEDGRTFLNKTQNQYDAIFVDVFKSSTPPYQLTTRQAVQKMNQILNPEGIVIVNIVSSLEGPNSKFPKAEYATFKSVFPQVYIYLVNPQVAKSETQNLILVALKNQNPPLAQSQNEELNSYLKNLVKDDIETAPILTDEFAPVDYFLKDINQS